MKRLLVLTSALALLGAVLPLAQAAPARPCTGGKLAGGDWPTLTGPSLGTNHQTAEKRLSTANVGQLQLAWTSAPSAFQSVPVAAGNCVYYTDKGTIIALDIKTGRQVFKSGPPLPYGPGLYSGPFAVTISNGRGHIGYDNNFAPRAAAFNPDTGQFTWHSAPVVFDYPAWQVSSPSVSGNYRLFTTTGPDYDPAARPGYAIMDVRTGKILAKRTTIPPALLKQGYAGGGIWGTPVIDPATLYAYAGTSNPYSKQRESQYDNAMIKIDMNPKRKTFGQIVALHKGDPDGVSEHVYAAPPCQNEGNQAGGTGFYPDLPCGQQDIDFGNSPSLWKAADGTLMVSQLQKSSVMHTVRASDMSVVWKGVPVGTHPFLHLTGGNHGNAATDGKRLYVMVNPGSLVAMEAATGLPSWTTPLAERTSSINVVLVNGVIFAADLLGVHAFDAATGVRLWDYIGQNSGLGCGGQRGGLSFARGHLFVACTGTVAAFRLP